MAEAFVNVTEGSGKKLHTNNRTIGANSVEDEYVLHGEPFLAEYRVMPGSTATSFATADSHVMQIMAGASLNVYIRRIRVFQLVAATAAAFTNWQLMRLSSAGTGGTALTPTPIEASDGASGATAMTLPTAKGSEGPSLDQAVAYVIQTIGASQSGDASPLMIDWDYRGVRQKAIKIPAGTANGIAVKNRVAIAGATGFVVVDYVEANF